MTPDAREAAALRRALGAWYAGARRDLPWRRTRDPYAIWVSETMLQQTRVEAVLGHYARFLERFPTLRALAEADEEDVVALWSGLGYYRRARALARAAREVQERHGGRLPEEPEALARLPGVGRYTAGAVASIAFERPAPIVDGNVARVFARLFAIEEPIDAPATQRALWRLAQALLPPARGGRGEPGPGAWSQALMELGALVCLPRAPDCPACPLAALCRARARGLEARLPARRPRPAPLAVRLEALLVERAGRVLLVRRPDGGRMEGLWELPTRELADGATRLWPPAFPAPPRARLEAEGPPLFELAHAITRHRVALAVRRGALRPERAAASPGRDAGWRWHEPGRSGDLALSGMTLKILERVPTGRRAASATARRPRG